MFPPAFVITGSDDVHAAPSQICAATCHRLLPASLLPGQKDSSHLAILTFVENACWTFSPEKSNVLLYTFAALQTKGRCIHQLLPTLQPKTVADTLLVMQTPDMGNDFYGGESMVAFDMPAKVKAGTEALELNDVVSLHWLIHIKMHACVHTCTEHLQAVH